MGVLGFVMLKCVFLKSICAPLALVCGVSGVVGTCMQHSTGGSAEKTREYTKSSENEKGLILGKSNAPKGSGSFTAKGKNKEGSSKAEGSVSSEKGSVASEGTSLTSEDKDKIIKILLNQQSTRGEQTIETKKKKKSEVAADYLQKFGSVGAFIYAMYGTVGIWRGDFNIKDVATTANAVLGLSAYGAAAVAKF